ncbi:MAG: DUF3486 family protein [Tabrizicola sp.]|jgi:hypothetical protein|nr:DUF3486 family protein [Tabrizicola sp.]
MVWPKTVPEDLRRRLEGVLGYRQFGPAEIWDELREWLEKQGIEPPLNAPLNPPVKDP